MGLVTLKSKFVTNNATNSKLKSRVNRQNYGGKGNAPRRKPRGIFVCLLHSHNAIVSSIF